jgi:gliding motility-associated-like protein
MRPGKLFATLLLLFASHFFCKAQQNNIWYFGTTAGLSFSPGSSNPVIPQPIYDGQLSTYEGCATICDATGNLLFYTNGKTVYNRKHEVMVNGQNLAGHPSSYQAAVIVRKPSSNDSFYVFTASAYEDNFAAGYNYSIIDMRQDAGYGSVVAKDIPLFSPGTERLMAARHANGTDAWIITNETNSNTFRVYLLSCNGLDMNPVISTIGKVLNEDDAQNIGSIKVSPDGKRLVQTWFPPLLNILNLENPFQLFDFDNATGVISNPKLIYVPTISYYSAEFSPDSRLLYATCSKQAAVDQFDCTMITEQDVIASRVVLPADKGFCGIQLGPDQKIYLARPVQYLSVISNPNQPGTACDLELNKIVLNRSCGIGLPSFVNDLSYNPAGTFITQITDSCNGIVQFNGPTTFGPGTQYSWDFGDGNTSGLANPIHTFSPSDQFYTIKLKVRPSGSCGYIEIAKTMLPRGITATIDYTYQALCESGAVQFSSQVTLYPEDAPVQLLWDFGDGNTSGLPNPLHTYANPGNYPVTFQILTGTACLDRSVNKSISLGALDIQVTPQFIEIDPGDDVQLQVTGSATGFSWSPPKGLSATDIANPVARPVKNTWYVVTATNSAGCTDKDSVFIKVRPVPGIYVPSAFTPNNDGKNDDFRPIISGIQYGLKDFTIFNRWGEKVFTTAQIDEGWNGNYKGLPQASGIYIWIMKATENGVTIQRKGTVVLIR